jgi:hypothetical protein
MGLKPIQIAVRSNWKKRIPGSRGLIVGLYLDLVSMDN